MISHFLLFPWRHAEEYREYLDHYRTNESGFVAGRDDRDAVIRDLDLHRKRMRERHEFRLSDANRIALERMISLADRNGFDIYLANSPLHHDLVADSAFAVYYGKIERELASFESKSPRFHFIRRIMAFGTDEMGDNVEHVKASTALAFTDSMADDHPPDGIPANISCRDPICRRPSHPEASMTPRERVESDPAR